MDILNIIDCLGKNAGGPSRTVPSLCEGIRAASQDCHPVIISSNSQKFGSQVELPKNIQVVTREISSEKDWLKTIEEISSQSSDRQIIHDHGQWLSCNRASATFAKRRDVPRVVTPRGMLSPWAMSQGRFKKALAWWAFGKRNMEQASLIHATSELEATELRNLGLTRPIAVIPNGVQKPTVHRNLKKKKQVVFMSRIHPKKGVAELVECWRDLNLSEWNLVLAGPDESNLIDSLRLQENDSIAYAGAVEGDAKWELLSESSLFILPTYSENFGVVVAEALMSGTPAITTVHAPWSDLVSQDCGWWIEMSKESIRNALLTATSLSVDTLAEMGNNGKRYASKSFAWEGIGQNMFEVYTWLLDGGDVPDCVLLF